MRGRAIPFSVMERAGFIGFALVIGLFVIGLTNDIGRLTGEGFEVADRVLRHGGDRPPRAPRRSLGARTMPEAFRLTVEDHPDRVAVRTKDDEVSLTWAQLRDRVDALAGGLAQLGVGRGDTVALMLGNRPEFHIADLAVMTLGATPFSIYPTFTPEQIAYVVGDAGAKVAIVEEQFLERFRARARGAAGARDASSCSSGARRRRHASPGTTSRAPTRTSTPSRTGARSSPRTS